jgi:pimeloyl-ACP methyl ester carboxylesterase
MNGVESTSMRDLREIRLGVGRVRCHDSGHGEPIVFLHGLLVDGRLWRKVIALLDGHARCIAPDLPLGSHRLPFEPDADLSPPGLASIVNDLLETLGLDAVTLVANDTGGAIAQLVAAYHPDRIRRLVLTNCDAFENFLPLWFRPLQYAARAPWLLQVAMQPMRFARVRRSPLAFGWLIKHDPPEVLLEDWLVPVRSDPAIRRDAVKVLRGIDPRHTIEAAQRLRSFRRPTLIAWATEDRLFPLASARRLAANIPGATLEAIDDSYTFIPEDQPERLAELIAEFNRRAA